MSIIFIDVVVVDSGCRRLLVVEVGVRHLLEGRVMAPVVVVGCVGGGAVGACPAPALGVGVPGFLLRSH